MTAGQKTNRSPLPTPPGDLDPALERYLNELVRGIEEFAEQIDNPGPLRGSVLHLSNLQRNGGGLRAGDIFSDGGVLTIIRPSDEGFAYAGTLVGTGAVGTVTVTTP
jgi:2-keto-4-pentenoate hydratase|tara:strand:- start:3679 stop:3999 length:321 start_codon:yes stop_codon:yes gene_type:complete